MAHQVNDFIDSKTIFLPISKESYQKFMDDNKYAKSIIDLIINNNPELFPNTIVAGGYCFYGTTAISKKQNIALRRIKTGQTVFQISPSFLLPNMVGRTDDVEKAMFLLKFHVPFWALSYVFGKDPKYWYRIYCHLGSYNLVGTTIKNPEKLPKDLLADEQHIVIKGNKAYIATTIGNGCFLGAQATESASEVSLEKAYGVFKKEVHRINLDYSPETVNMDGWSATRNSWKGLFSFTVIIQCFLHAFIKIRDRALKRDSDIFQKISEKVWNAYNAKTKKSFSQRIRHLKNWAQKSIPESIMKSKLLELCSKRKLWTVYYDHPNAKRTSNALDRLMKFMSRHLYMHQNYHGNIYNTTLNIRAFCLIHNFAPFNPWTIKQNNGQTCPAEKANNFIYHPNWMHNLLISCSIQSRYFLDQQKMT